MWERDGDRVQARGKQTSNVYDESCRRNLRARSRWIRLARFASAILMPVFRSLTIVPVKILGFITASEFSKLVFPNR